MPAPTGGDGSKAAFELLAPSGGLIFAIVITKYFAGGVAAGIIYLLILSVILGEILLNAIYWNVNYTIGYVFSALLYFFIVPSIASQFLHPVFGVIARVMFVGFTVILFYLFANKLNMV